MQTIDKDCLDTEEDLSNLVSVFIPCYNETLIIERLLDALYHQDYPRASMEIIIVDGMSTDDTREKIQHFAHNHPDLNIRIIDNRRKRVTYAINEGLKAAKGGFLVRMDAHSIPASNYVSLCIENLQAGKGDNVGGLLDIQPMNDSYAARCIATAAAHPLGSGGAQYRSGSEAATVDTVAFGAFTRNTLQRNGLFNEALMANEDYEWNTRLRSKGGRIWFDPAIRCQYFPRGSYRALAKQYFNYGFWKVAMLRLYPDSLRLRQMAPPVITAGLILAILIGILGGVLGWSYAPLLGCGCALAYYIALSIGCQVCGPKMPLALTPGVAFALMVMHLSWGSGFWISLLKNRKKPPSQQ